MQPPSGGCVLKLSEVCQSADNIGAAAFGRLCVETSFMMVMAQAKMAAAFGRLCVETEAQLKEKEARSKQPPSGGCVLKLFEVLKILSLCESSRLRAVVC